MPPRRRSSAAARPVPPDLVVVRLVSAVPAEAALLALPTRSGPADVKGAAAVLVGQPPDGTTTADLSARLLAEEANGGPGELVTYGEKPGPRLLLTGTGQGTPAELRRAAAALVRRAKGDPVLVLDLRDLHPDGDGLRAVAEAAVLASYSFTTRADPTPRRLREVVLVVPVPTLLQPDLDHATATATAVALARDLVNTPSLGKTPAWLADRAAQVLTGLTVRVRDEVELAAEGFGGIVGVGQGSTRPPRLVEARYDGGGRRHVVLVGKGITFDTGGLSLKPSDSMLTMKSDMGGAAAVLGTLRAVADLGLPLTVTALLACAENMPSGTAQRPGDVLTQYGGRTVEVLNTDAEGRLVLADALAYADRDLRADVIVDVATLTGAMPVALGRRHAGLFSSDDALAAQLEAASTASGERLWRMPLVEDYRQALDSPTADLRNIGDPKKKLGGGSITAALFLREFAGGRPWAHLDIAGPSWSGSDEDELTKGATGYGVRLLVRWLEALAAEPRRGAPRRPAGPRPSRWPHPRAGTTATAAGGQGSSTVPLLSIWTPAEASPSNPVTGLAAPRQLSSSFGSANHMPTALRSVREPVALLNANASSTIAVNTLVPLPAPSVKTSPRYSAAPKGAPDCCSRNTVKAVRGLSFSTRIRKVSLPLASVVRATSTCACAFGKQAASCGEDGLSTVWTTLGAAATEASAAAAGPPPARAAAPPPATSAADRPRVARVRVDGRVEVRTDMVFLLVGTAPVGSVGPPWRGAARAA